MEMADKKVGDLYSTIVPKHDTYRGDLVVLREGRKVLGVGKILWITAIGGALMKVIVEVVKWVGK